MSEVIMGQIGEYRELDPRERQEYLMRLISAPGNERLAIQEAGPKAIAEMFNEALACLTDGGDWLERINSQYDSLYPDDGCEPPQLHFWSAVYGAIKPLRDLLEGLEAAEKHMPKKAEPLKRAEP